MNEALAGRVVVIIGGTSGMGLSAVQACLKAGARVVAVGLRESGAPPSDSVRVQVADACDSATAERAIETALEAFGGFDALYHVAGGSGRKHGDGPLHEVTDEGAAYTLRLNLQSVIYSNRAAVQAFLERKTPGAVLNMGSVSGFSPSPKFFAAHAYAAAKAGILGFTQSCAAYYAPHNIRFNVVAPGVVDTPMAKRATGDGAIMDYVKRKQPLDGGRIGRPDDLDAAVVYFLSEQSRFVTGQVLAIDGGWTAGGALAT